MIRPNTPTYKTLNWPASNKALKRRGSLAIWFDPDMVFTTEPRLAEVPLAVRTAAARVQARCETLYTYLANNMKTLVDSGRR